MTTLAPLLAITLGLLGSVAGWTDYRYRRIPNWLVIAGFSAGLTLNIWLFGFAGAKSALLGAGLATAVYLPLYLLRAVGGGDLKLMIAVGAICGPTVWLLLFIVASLLGGVVAIILVLKRASFGRTLSNIGVVFNELFHLRLPYLNRPHLDVTADQGIRLPHGTVIASAIGLYLLAAGLN